MTPRPIGYYVHHQGNGHRARALAVADHAPDRFVLLGTGLAGRSGGLAAIELDDDRPIAGAGPADRLASALHYAPIDHEGVRRRIARLAGWIAEARPALMVIDVSVEVAMLARLASVPTAYMRLSGARHDAPHLEAFANARLLMAPFHDALDDRSVPPWVVRKTRYLPGLVRAPPAARASGDSVLLVNGGGGEAIDGERVAQAARATPDFHWHAIGPVSVPPLLPDNLDLHGWVADPAAAIGHAGIVIGAAGDGLVSAVLAAGRPFICLPQPRPYGEQAAKAARLGALGAAVVIDRWPEAAEWPALLRAAAALDPAPARSLHDHAGASHACAAMIAASQAPWV